MKPTNSCPAKNKWRRQEKQKRKGGEKAERKSQDCCVTFKGLEVYDPTVNSFVASLSSLQPDSG